MPVPYPEPLTLECFDPNGCRVTVSNVSNLEFSRDDGATWKTYKNAITFKNGEKICFRGTWSTQDTGSSSRTQFACIGKCYIYGNIMSLLDKDNYATMTELPYASTFMNLFMENRDIYHAEGKDLVLPATKLRKNCYANMFNGCTNFNYVKCLATDISASGCTSNWLRSTARRGTFVKADGMNDWTRYYNGIPEGWTIINASEEPTAIDHSILSIDHSSDAVYDLQGRLIITVNSQLPKGVYIVNGKKISVR